MTEPYYQILPTLAWEDFPDEVVVIDLDHGNYFDFQAAGADVFRCLAVPTTVAEVVGRLVDRYEAAPTELESGVTAFIERLRYEGLVVPAVANAGTPRELPALSGRLPLTGLDLSKHEDLQQLLVVDPVRFEGDETWPPRPT